MSTHGLGLAGLLSARCRTEPTAAVLVLHFVEVADVGVGYGLSPTVERATATVVSAVLSEIAAAS